MELIQKQHEYLKSNVPIDKVVNSYTYVDEKHKEMHKNIESRCWKDGVLSSMGIAHYLHMLLDSSFRAFAAKGTVYCTLAPYTLWQLADDFRFIDPRIKFSFESIVKTTRGGKFQFRAVKDNDTLRSGLDELIKSYLGSRFTAIDEEPTFIDDTLFGVHGRLAFDDTTIPCCAGFRVLTSDDIAEFAQNTCRVKQYCGFEVTLCFPARMFKCYSAMSLENTIEKLSTLGESDITKSDAFVLGLGTISRAVSYCDTDVKTAPYVFSYKQSYSSRTMSYDDDFGSKLPQPGQDVTFLTAAVRKSLDSCIDEIYRSKRPLSDKEIRARVLPAMLNYFLAL